MSEPTCKTCPWFLRWGGNVNDCGDCRAHPPIVVVDTVRHFREKACDEDRYDYGQRYPTVSEREFCAEHPERSLGCTDAEVQRMEDAL